MLKLISSLEKYFLDEPIASKASLVNASLLKNEVFRFGACYTTEPHMLSGSKQVVKLIFSHPLLPISKCGKWITCLSKWLRSRAVAIPITCGQRRDCIRIY